MIRSPAHPSAWKRLLLVGALLALGACGRFFPWRAADRDPVVVLVDPEVEPGVGGDAARFALGTLLTDALEYQGGLSVVRSPFSPGAEALARGRNPEGLVLRSRVAREGDKLVWTLRKARFRDLQAAEGYKELVGPALPPGEAFRWVLSQVTGSARRGAQGPDLLPAHPRAFWGLVGAMARGNEPEGMDRAIAELEGLAREEPACVAVQVQLGTFRYFRMNNSTRNPAEDQAAALAALKRARELAPGFGRSTAFFSRLLTDVGSPREALVLLEEARRPRPKDLTLLGAITYPARYAGLLDLATAATDRFQTLNPLENRPPRLAFHLLYAGRLEAFQGSLWEWPGDVRNATCRFHRAQVALMRSERERALALFRETEQMNNGLRVYRTLSRVHRLALEGQGAEAARALRALQEERAGLRVPDGEVTMLLAEAHVVLGNVPEGMALARAAFSQGFGCTRWYEENPLLAPLRRHAQWPWLHQHLLERQALLEARFPKAVFGL